MKLLRRAKLLILSGGLALGGLTLAAAPAHANWCTTCGPHPLPLTGDMHTYIAGNTGCRTMYIWGENLTDYEPAQLVLWKDNGPIWDPQPTYVDQTTKTPGDMAPSGYVEWTYNNSAGSGTYRADIRDGSGVIVWSGSYSC